MQYAKSLFWFKRDLRADDNTGLFYAASECSEVVPIYVLEDGILSTLPPLSKRLAFVADSLRRLDSELRLLGSKLLVFRGSAEEIIPELVKKLGIEAVYTNRAHGFSGVKRDLDVERRCKSLGTVFRKYEDTFLVPPHEIEQRKVFTPFYKLWQNRKKRTALLTLERINTREIDSPSIESLLRSLGCGENTHWPADYADRRLGDFNFEEYGDTRNFPYMDGTSRLSPYLRFGLVSVRKVYNAAAEDGPEPGPYVSELAWREFWYHIMHYFPDTRNLEFQEKRRNIKWINNEAWYEAWKEGRTGYPIVDAGMRQLKEEGWIHNRVRMIVASFLTKDLITDWRWGDRHFFDHLVDYDETVDIGNWQWTASCGADPKPFRIFNPMLQSEKYDPECTYIKRYIPELSSTEPEKIHNPLTYKLPYHRPIVNHYEMRNLAHEAFSGGRIDDQYISRIIAEGGHT